jgi:hypothetical protein
MLSENQLGELERFRDLSGSDARGIPLDDLRSLASALGIDSKSFGRKKLELLAAVLERAGLSENKPQNAPQGPQNAAEDEGGVVVAEEHSEAVDGDSGRSGGGRGKRRKKDEKVERDFAYWVNTDSGLMHPWAKGQKVLFRIGGDALMGSKNEFSAEIGVVSWTVHSSETNEITGLGLIRENGTTITIIPSWAKMNFIDPGKPKRKRKQKDQKDEVED